jgi:hypothetical protein
MMVTEHATVAVSKQKFSTGKQKMLSFLWYIQSSLQSSGVACHWRFPSHYIINKMLLQLTVARSQSFLLKLWVWQAPSRFHHSANHAP